MAQSFAPREPMQSVLQICTDLQLSGTPFSISLRVEGSISFSLSTLPGEQAKDGHGDGRAWRGPSYLRRQSRRSLKKQINSQQSLGGGGEGGSSNTCVTPSQTPDGSEKTWARNPKTESVMTSTEDLESEVSGVPGFGEVRPNEEGRRKGCDDVKKMKSFSKRLSLLAAQNKRIQDEIKFQKQIHRASLKVLNHSCTQIYSEDEDYGFSDDYIKDKDLRIKTIREKFGFPDIDSEREWLKDSEDEQKEFVNHHDEQSKCPNCYQQTSRFHICDDDDVNDV